jgi:hypothetical protein
VTTDRATAGSGAHHTRRVRDSGESGQILVIFGLSILVLVGAAGLAVDAGGTYAQRRDQQVAADLAALAAANEYLVHHVHGDAVDLGRSVASQNGFADGVGGAEVGIDLDTAAGVRVRVTIDADHQNSFLRMVGFEHFDVSTAATAIAGYPDTGVGVGPFVFSVSAFEDDGTPRYQTLTAFGDTNSHAPTGPTDFAWTNYGIGNVNTSQVRNIISGALVIDKTLTYGEYIGQHNNGNHTALFSDVNNYLAGKDVPVAVVDDNGNFQGWSMFRVVSAQGGSTKKINGYFLANFVTSRTQVMACELIDMDPSVPECPRYFGAYVLRLSD